MLSLQIGAKTSCSAALLAGSTGFIVSYLHFRMQNDNFAVEHLKDSESAETCGCHSLNGDRLFRGVLFFFSSKDKDQSKEEEDRGYPAEGLFIG